MSIFWSKNFVNDFQILNENKIVSTILWKENDEKVYSQLSDCIENKSDIILSEILPNELPAETTISEYKYFIDKFLYCPPHAHPLTENVLLEKGHANLVIIDENYKGIFANNIVKEVFLKEIIKPREYDLLNYNNTLSSLSDINESLKNASNVVLISGNPLLVSYIIQSSLVFNYEFNIHPELKNSARLHGLGLTVENDHHQSITESVRSKFDSIINNRVKLFIHSKKTIESLTKLDSVESFESFQEDSCVRFYYRKLHKLRIHDYLWCGALPTNKIGNRFERRFVHSILKSTDSTETKLLNFSIKCFVKDYFISLSNNYSSDGDETINVITSFIIEYYYKHQNILDDIFEEIKPHNDRTENAIYSIIGECFILAYFSHDLEKEIRELFLIKAHFYLSKDMVNGKTRYIHFDSYIDLLELIRKRDECTLEIEKTNFDFQFNLIPFLYNQDDQELIIRNKEHPNKYEILCFFKNTIRAIGIYRLYLKNNLLMLSENSNICDFYNRHSEFPISCFLNILLNNSIIDNYNSANIDTNQKIICLIFYTKFNKSSIDPFILGLIDIDNIKNDESIMLFSCLSKDSITDVDNLEFINELRQKSIFKILKPNNVDNYIFNFCLYRLSILIDHPDSNKLLRLSESQNPFHYYLQSQFELE